MSDTCVEPIPTSAAANQTSRNRPLPRSVGLKPPSAFKLIGQPLPQQADGFVVFAHRHQGGCQPRVGSGLLGSDLDAPAPEPVVPELATSVVEHAFQCDLVVVSQVDREGDSGIEADFAERVVMESGRPVLVVPLYGAFSECGRRAMVAWNGRREAARAAFDAVPLLQACEAVRVTWLDPQDALDVPGSLPGAELATALSRHGIDVTAEALPTAGIGVGEALLSHASDLGADLLVMGAYGHSRTREYVFGGATRTIFDSMTVPVLMSH